MPDTRFITEFDQYLFGQGTHYDLYNKLGAHPMTVDGEEGVYFAVWAPNAAAVSIVGDFNECDTDGTFRTTWNLSDISYRDKSGRYL